MYASWNSALPPHSSMSSMSLRARECRNVLLIASPMMRMRERLAPCRSAGPAPSVVDHMTRHGRGDLYRQLDEAGRQFVFRAPSRSVRVDRAVPQVRGQDRKACSRGLALCRLDLPDVMPMARADLQLVDEAMLTSGDVFRRRPFGVMLETGTV